MVINENVNGGLSMKIKIKIKSRSKNFEIMGLWKKIKTYGMASSASNPRAQVVDVLNVAKAR